LADIVNTARTAFLKVFRSGVIDRDVACRWL
jgi:hypothetical protein